MGQKIRPTGFRTGIMVDWQSQWYAGPRQHNLIGCLRCGRNTTTACMRRRPRLGEISVSRGESLREMIWQQLLSKVLMPMRVKFRKHEPSNGRGNAQRADAIAIPECSFRPLERGGAIVSRRLPAPNIRGKVRLYIRVFPHRSAAPNPLGNHRYNWNIEPKHRAAVMRIWPTTFGAAPGSIR